MGGKDTEIRRGTAGEQGGCVRGLRNDPDEGCEGEGGMSPPQSEKHRLSSPRGGHHGPFHRQGLAKAGDLLKVTQPVSLGGGATCGPL